jgi:hypothetical protein
MLSMYTTISRKNNLCGVYEDEFGKHNKILFKGSPRECMEYILEREPENPIKRDYESYFK